MAATIKQFVRQWLADFKVPARQFVDQLPRTRPAKSNKDCFGSFAS